jgi:hypothetical protein
VSRRTLERRTPRSDSGSRRAFCCIRVATHARAHRLCCIRVATYARAQRLCCIRVATYASAHRLCCIRVATYARAQRLCCIRVATHARAPYAAQRLWLAQSILLHAQRSTCASGAGRAACALRAATWRKSAMLVKKSGQKAAQNGPKKRKQIETRRKRESA